MLETFDSVISTSRHHRVRIPVTSDAVCFSFASLLNWPPECTSGQRRGTFTRLCRKSNCFPNQTVYDSVPLPHLLLIFPPQRPPPPRRRPAPRGQEGGCWSWREPSSAARGGPPWPTWCTGATADWGVRAGPETRRTGEVPPGFFSFFNSTRTPGVCVWKCKHTRARGPPVLYILRKIEFSTPAGPPRPPASRSPPSFPLLRHRRGALTHADGRPSK